jgi:hypothetical protein
VFHDSGLFGVLVVFGTRFKEKLEQCLVLLVGPFLRNWVGNGRFAHRRLQPLISRLGPSSATSVKTKVSRSFACFFYSLGFFGAHLLSYTVLAFVLR